MAIAFDAGAAANFAVAAGTLVLALFTWRLARETMGAVAAAEEQARLSGEALSIAIRQATSAEQQVLVGERQAEIASRTVRASIQPMLVAVPPQLETPEQVPRWRSQAAVSGHRGLVLVVLDGNSWEISIPLRNVGPGVAVVRGLSLQAGEVGWSGRMSSSIVAATEQTRFSFLVPPERDDLAPLKASLDSGTVDLVVAYTDISGLATFRTRASLHRAVDSTSWAVRQVFLYADDEPDPFAASGPSGE